MIHCLARSYKCSVGGKKREMTRLLYGHRTGKVRQSRREHLTNGIPGEGDRLREPAADKYLSPRKWNNDCPDG